MSDRKPSSVESLRELRRRGVDVGTILDVGANTSSPPLLTVFPDRRHILFEPVAEHEAGLRHNYRAVDHEIVFAAVSDMDGDTALTVQSTSAEITVTSSRMVSDEMDATRQDLRTTPMISLDSFLSARPQKPPYLLKVDVDGAEARVLAGGRSALQDTSVIMLEMTVHSFFELTQLISQCEFALFDLVDFCYYDGRLASFDAIFIRSELDNSDNVSLFKGKKFDLSLWRVFKG